MLSQKACGWGSLVDVTSPIQNILSGGISMGGIENEARLARDDLGKGGGSLPTAGKAPDTVDSTDVGYASEMACDGGAISMLDICGEI